MDVNEVLAQIRGLVTSYNNGGKWDNTDTDDLVRLVDDLDTWMMRHGFLPTEWAPSAEQHPPRVEMIHDRDYDGDCDITVYIEGKPVSGYDEYSFDPGRGQDFRDYADTLAEWVAHAHPKLKARLRESAYAAITDRYVVGVPDDNRVAHRYFDLLVSKYENEEEQA